MEVIMMEKKQSIVRIVLFITGLMVLSAFLILFGLLNYEVCFQDKGLEEAVRDNLGKPEGCIYKRDLLTISNLDASGRDIKYLAGIEELSNLEVLNLEDNYVRDVSPLRLLTKLKELSFRNNEITDLEEINFQYISNLSLRTLSLRHNVLRPEDGGDQIRLSDICLLRHHTSLEKLELRDNHINNIASLSELINLQVLDLRENHLTDISPLKNLTALKKLNLRENEIENLSPLKMLTDLEYLNIHSNNGIKSIEPLNNLIKLQTLIMRNVSVEDKLNVIQNMPELNRLNIRNCSVNDTAALAELMAEGALQDNPEQGIKAIVDIRDNPLPDEDNDPYIAIRRYWPNISDRLPFDLPGIIGEIQPPMLSKMSGFYDNNFLLQILHNDFDNKIYYTLDGSEPTKDSLLYKNPIMISNRKEDPNYLSVIPTSNSWKEPAGKVFKGTVVRAGVIMEDGTAGPIVTHNYFIDKQSSDRYSLPVVALATNEEYLFDEDEGIYTIANAEKRGRSRERPVHIEFFEPDGTPGFAQNAGVRIHGGASRVRRQKSLRLYARAEYDTQDYFAYELFPGLTKPAGNEPLTVFKTLILRNSGNDWHSTMFRDALMQSLVEHSERMETQAYRPVIVFINGEYWGIHNLRERYDTDYVQNNYDISREKVAIMEGDAELKAGSSEDQWHYEELREFIRDNDISDTDNYQYVLSQMDVESFIVYYVSNIYFHNTDWPHNNIDYWRVVTENREQPYGHDGRWRWMLYDTDFGFGLQGPTRREVNEEYLEEFEKKYGTLEGPTANTLKWTVLPQNLRYIVEWPNIMFRNLLNNDDFKFLFINTMADYLNSYFDRDRVISRINKMQNTLSPEIEEHINRWSVMDNSKKTWHSNVDVMRDFAKQRPDYVRQHIIDHFNINGAVNVTLNSDSQQGYIIINSLQVTDNTPGITNPDSWQGVYFTDVPVEITAVPLAGYEFAGWKEIEHDGATISLLLTEDITLTAVFSQQL